MKRLKLIIDVILAKKVIVITEDDCGTFCDSYNYDEEELIDVLTNRQWCAFP